MVVKTKKEIQLMRESAAILSLVHAELKAALEIGVSTTDLDAIAEQYIRKAGAEPSFKGYQGFPASICVSVNEEVVHGIPTGYRLQDGDIVSLDCGVYYQGFHSDCAFTHGIGNVAQKHLDLMSVTEKALYKGIDAARVGNTIGDIGYAIEKYVKSEAHNVIKLYSGHGIGRELHEKPLVPNYGKPGSGLSICEGMVLAIEPIVTIGSPEVYTRGAWRVITRDKGRAAHFEHTVAIVDGKAEILTK